MRTYATFTDGVSIIAKASSAASFIKKAGGVFQRFEIEVYEEDVFPYDEKEEGGWGEDGEQSLEAFLKDRGVSLNGKETPVVVIVEDEIEGVQVCVEAGKAGKAAKK